MEMFLSCLLDTFAALLAVPVATLFLEIIAAITLPSRRPLQESFFRGRVAVLVPAHDESTGILPTLADIQSQLRTADRIIVVADNCSDDTAVVAARTGAEVVERHDSQRFGKGYALDFGLDHISEDPPDIVLVVDADCRLSEGAIYQLASACVLTQRPVQALYLMTAPLCSPVNYQVAEFAWRIKNWLRPLGLSHLGLPCQLLGTGMAFPWSTIRSANLANGWIVEDLKLGLDLAVAAHGAVFCPSARVTSEFPRSIAGAAVQRQRWEHGHIRTILDAPRLCLVAFGRFNWELLALALDLAVPPLSLTAILLAGLVWLAGMATLCGLSSLALTIALLCSLGFGLAVFLAWLVHGRDVLPPGAVVSIAMYIYRKLPMYAGVLTGRRAAHWIRTDRK
jgi:cellulose synthase/poly-beta-1,6-N-acetylglucosamine synthase-like glycosyltransferase